MVDPNL
jgi:hypothetical protein